MFNEFVKKMIFKNIFSIERGRPVLYGKVSFTMYPARAMAITLQDIAEKNGEDFLFDLGYKAGFDYGNELKETLKFTPKNPATALKVIKEVCELQGFGRFEIIMFKLEEGKAQIVVRDNPVIEWAAKLYGEKSKVCSFYRGVYSAHGLNDLMVRECHLIEKECMCKGYPVCVWYTEPKQRNPIEQTTKAETNDKDIKELG